MRPRSCRAVPRPCCAMSLLCHVPAVPWPCHIPSMLHPDRAISTLCHVLALLYPRPCPIPSLPYPSCAEFQVVPNPSSSSALCILPSLSCAMAVSVEGRSVSQPVIPTGDAGACPSRCLWLSVPPGCPRGRSWCQGRGSARCCRTGERTAPVRGGLRLTPRVAAPSSCPTSRGSRSCTR